MSQTAPDEQFEGSRTSNETNATMGDDPRWPSALRYIELRWPTFVLNVSKRPIANCPACDTKQGGTRHDPTACDHLLCHGFYAATLDPERIAEMLRRIPDGVLAIATGAVSGVDAIDFESTRDRDDEPTGLEVHDAWESWVADSDHSWSLPKTLAATTGGGGVHLLYRHTPGARSRVRVLPSVDIKADGGYIAVPCGVGSRAWVEPVQEVAQPSVELASWFVKAKGRRAAKDGSKNPGEWQQTTSGTGRTFDWSILDEPSIPPGEQNWTLYRAACSCRARRDEDPRARRLLADLVGRFADQPGRVPWGDPHDEAWTMWDRVKAEIPEGSSESPQDTIPEWEFLKLHQKAKERDWDLQELLRLQRQDDMRDFLRDVRRERKMNETAPAWADVGKILEKFKHGVTPQRPSVFSFIDQPTFGLFYEGEGNVIYGDQELGKTWLMAACSAWFINRDQHVVWFAHDNMTKERVIQRLLQVGAKYEKIEKFFHISEEPSTIVPKWDFPVKFVVLDSMNPTITMLGINANQTGDGVDTVVERFVRPFTSQGATVVIIDHENDKGKQTGNRRKGHAVQGITLRLTTFSRGRQGGMTISAMHVEKDNPGGSGIPDEGLFGYLRVDGRGRIDGGALVTVVRELPKGDVGQVTIDLSAEIGEKVFGSTTLMDGVRAFMANVEYLMSVVSIKNAIRQSLRNIGQETAAEAYNEGNVGTYLARLHKLGEIVGWQETAGRRKWYFRKQNPGETGPADGETPPAEDEVDDTE